MNSLFADKLRQEKYWLTATMMLLWLCMCSGTIELLAKNFTSWIQINLIVHTITGGISAIPIFIYCAVHFKRTIGHKSSLLILSGLLMTGSLLVLIISGFWFSANGSSENTLWIAQSHTYGFYIFLASLTLHIFGHIYHRQRKRTLSKRRFMTLPQSSSIILMACLVFYLSGVTITSTLYTYMMIKKQPPLVTNYVYDYGDHPFRPSQTETINGTFIATPQIAKSKQCGSCHSDIYNQWLSSAHRQAASDPAYVKNIHLLEKTRGITATRYCEGCHAPVALLSGQLTPGGKHGGVANTSGHLEGIGCLGCHGISAVTHLNGTASYVFDPKEYYLFDSSERIIPQKIRNFLIRLNARPHKAAMGSSLLEDPKLCASCHEQFMDKSMNDWGWVKMQSEYSHWLASPFSGQTDNHFKTETSLTCQNCHFPLVKGQDPSADEDGFIHSHRSLGANTVLPTLNGDKIQLAETTRFLQNANILVDIEQPHRQDTIQSQQFIQEQLRPNDRDNTPFFLYLGEEAKLRVIVTNRMIGHAFPGGTTDINQAWLYFKVSDAEGTTIYESGRLNEQLELDKSAHIYHSIPIDRAGAHVWRHDLFRMVGDAYRNVINAGKSDIKEYTFHIPTWAKEPITATAILKYRKFNQRYARWALDHPKPVLPVVSMARDSLIIPLKINPPIYR